MFTTLLFVVLAQVIPCTPGEMSLACTCKQGMASACMALVAENADDAATLLDKVVDALEALDKAVQMKGESERDKKEKERLRAIAQALSQGQASSEHPNCKGQEHHPISRPVAEKLAKHPTLKGLYKPRDPRFVARANNQKAHCGYQDWHRKVDQEIINWLDENPKATSDEFMKKLRDIYDRPEMKERFPNDF